MRQLQVKRHGVPPDIIRHSIRLYARLATSFRDVVGFLALRGLNVSCEAVRGSRLVASVHLDGRAGAEPSGT